MSPAACLEETYTAPEGRSEWIREPDAHSVEQRPSYIKVWHSIDAAHSFSDDITGWVKDTQPKIWTVFINNEKASPISVMSADEAKFRRLVDEWHEETDMHSSLLRVISHPAYLKIIAMGQDAIPMILREMKRGPGHWLPAIQVLTEDLLVAGEDPARGCTTSSEARAAWVRWGVSKGYL
jgi:hypothetical protein